MILKFKPNNKWMDECIGVIVQANEQVEELEKSLTLLCEKLESLQEKYDLEFAAQAKRIGMANMPVEYIIFASMDAYNTPELFEEAQKAMFGDNDV